MLLEYLLPVVFESSLNSNHYDKFNLNNQKDSSNICESHDQLIRGEYWDPLFMTYGSLLWYLCGMWDFEI